MLPKTTFEHRPPGYQREFLRSFDQGVSPADEIKTPAIDALYPPAGLLSDVAKSKLPSDLTADFLQFAFPQDPKEIGPVDDAPLLLGCQALLQQPLPALRQRLPYFAPEAAISQCAWISVNQLVIQPRRAFCTGLAVQLQRGEKLHLDRRFADLHPFVAERSIQVIGCNGPGAIRLPLDADPSAPHGLQPADVGLHERLRCAGVVLEVKVSAVTPMRLSDARNGPVNRLDGSLLGRDGDDDAFWSRLGRISVANLDVVDAAVDGIDNKAMTVRELISEASPYDTADQKSIDLFSTVDHQIR